MGPQTKKLTKLTDIFHEEDKRENASNQVEVDKLVPFTNHPFKLYAGSRLDDMVNSVKELGVLSPLLVRKHGVSNYEILSGHNRWNAAKIAGLEKVPVVIMDGLSDDEAMLIVTETNLIQRSFSDLVPSERACVLAKHYEAVKNQGKRMDLLNEIKMILNADEMGDEVTSDLVDQKLDSREETAVNYDMSGGTVARYLRINELSDNLKEFVDGGMIGFYAAVDISYLDEQQQAYLVGFLNCGKKVDTDKAKLLHKLRKEGKLNELVMEKVLDGNYKPKKKKSVLKGFKMNTNVMKKYFSEEQTAEEIQSEIEKALNFYYSHREEG